jgi:hypothetical protein
MKASNRTSLMLFNNLSLRSGLYLPEASEDFESVASDIVETIRINDQRFGVEPKERKRKK